MQIQEKERAELIGGRIRKLAKEKGVSLQELGERIGVARPTIYAYVAGTLRLSEHRLARIAEVLETDMEFFLRPPDEALDLQDELNRSLLLTNAYLTPPDPRQAVELANEVVDRSSQTPDKALRAEALLQSGRSLTMQGDYIGAVTRLEAAISAFRELGDQTRMARAYQTLGFCSINLGRIEAAQEQFLQAIEKYPSEEGWKAEVALAAIYERVGDFDEASRRLNSLLQDELGPEELTYVVASQASLAGARGNWLQAVEFADEGLGHAFESRTGDQMAELLILCGFAKVNLGDFLGASIDLVRATEIALAMNDEARYAFAQAATCNLLWRTGNLSEARELAVEVLSHATRQGYRRTEVALLVLLAQIAFSRGDWESARDYAMQAESYAKGNRYVSYVPIAEAIRQGAEAFSGRTERLGPAVSDAEEILRRLDTRASSLEAKAYFALALNGKGDDEKARQTIAEARNRAAARQMWPLVAELDAMRGKTAGPSGEAQFREPLDEFLQSHCRRSVLVHQQGRVRQYPNHFISVFLESESALN